MKKALILITIILIFGFIQSEKKVISSYTSEPNGTADIKVRLFDNHTFTFKMKIFEDGSKVNSTGAWQENGTAYRLTFKTEKPNLKALFDESYYENQGFQVINENSVDIDPRKKQLWIWGVSCLKDELIKTTTSNISIAKQKIYADKAKADLGITIKEFKSEKMENYSFENPYVNGGTTQLCNGKKSKFVLVSFKSKSQKGFAYFFYKINETGVVVSTIQHGFTIEQPDVMYKTALKAEETDYWECGAAD